MSRKERELIKAAKSFGGTLDQPFFTIFMKIIATPEYVLANPGPIHKSASS